MKRVRQY